jgi:hypothetical protein
MGGGVYVPRSPTASVLYGVVRAHWSDFVLGDGGGPERTSDSGALG